jgi:diguanylate cyclase (GGDEF)-like protein
LAEPTEPGVASLNVRPPVDRTVRLRSPGAEFEGMLGAHLRDRRRNALGLAVAGNIIPVAIATATDFSSHHPIFFVGAVGACIPPLVVTVVPRRWQVVRRIAAYAGLPMLTLMQAYSGGAASPYAVLMMMAMVWFGFQASDREVLAMVVVLAGCAYLPMLLVGAPAFPVHWGNATLLVLIGATVAGSLRMAMRETMRVTERLRREAVIDPLTGLLNRRGWEPSAQKALDQARRLGSMVAIVTLDLDGFKQVNDSSGHDYGDRILRETADRLLATMRASDVVARLGGDEFAALLIQSTPEGAIGAIKRLREITPAPVTFSAGIAIWEAPETLSELLRRADLAMYAAKASGGDRAEMAPTALTPEALGSLRAA